MAFDSKTGKEARSKASPRGENKATKQVKEVWAEVFASLQEDPKVNLKAWGKENPTDFYKLASKLIPLQLSGDKDNPVKVEFVFNEVTNESRNTND